MMMFRHNESESYFEMDVEGQKVVAVYRIQDSKHWITRVETPVTLRGRGEAGKLMQMVMDYARENDLKIVPVCPYAVSWLHKHPEFNDIIG